MSTSTATMTQVHRVWIKATPQAVWDAVTKAEWVDRYGYGGLPDWGDTPSPGPFEIAAGTAMQQEGIHGAMIDGEILDVDAPRRLVMTWRMLMDDGVKAEGFTRLTYDVTELTDGVTRLTITHELDGAPDTFALVSGDLEGTGAGGGWGWMLSDLKSLLETGQPLPRWS